MFNPNRSSDIARIRTAITAAHKFMEPFRDARRKMLKQFAGHGEHPGASDVEVPLNLLEMYVSTMTRFLAARSPRVRAVSTVPALRGTARKIELSVDQLLEEIGFEDTQQRMVKDALVGLGVVKTGINLTDRGAGWSSRIGDPFADVVSLDDFIFDHPARRWDEVGWAGNEFRIPLEVARNTEMFDRSVREELKASEDRLYHAETGSERVEALSHGIFWDTDHYEPYVRLLDLWFPREGLYVTLGEDLPKPLLVRKWDAHPSGPYHLLSFNDVPDNIMPVSPAALLADLHEIMNHMVSKAADQASRQKTVLGVQGASLDDGDRIVHASDGHVIRLTNPQGAKEYRFGGADPTTLAFTIQVRDWFNWASGNIDVLAGLGSAAETATQEGMLAASSSKRVEAMQEKTEAAVREIIECLAWYDYNDPILQRNLRYQLFEGPNGTMQMPFSPQERFADFLSFNIDLEPYSMQHLSPQAALKQLMGTFNALAPYIPMMMQQGATLNFPGLVKEISRLSPGMPDLSQFIMFGDTVPQGSGTGFRHGVTMSPVTSRETVRRGAPGGTQAGRDAALQQSLMAASGRSQTGGGQY